MNADCGHPLEWHNCYSGQIDIWHPSAYSHPAKMSPALCFRIFEHLEELDLLRPGQIILDPLAGIGTTGLVAALKGYPSILIELEDKFVKLAQANADHIALKGFGASITIIQGDARQLSRLLQERGLIGVTSPPYQTGTGEGHSLDPLQTGKGTIRGRGFTSKGPTYASDTGSTPGQIGALPDKPIAVFSPPYSDTEKRDRSKETSHASEADHPRGDLNISQGIQGSEGNIANLPDRPYVSITSPPYEDSDQAGAEKEYNWQRKSGKAFNKGASMRGYPFKDGQIGQEQGQTYLEAMKIVYAEIAKVADVLVVVIKNPTRNGKLRRLDLDTIALLEATGWTLYCQHRAILFEEQEMGHLFEGQVKKPRGRLSFFRRLAYRKGLPTAQWEDVLVAVKNGAGGLCAVTSPPYEDSRLDPLQPTYSNPVTPLYKGFQPSGYGETEGQIGKLRDK